MYTNILNPAYKIRTGKDLGYRKGYVPKRLTHSENQGVSDSFFEDLTGKAPKMGAKVNDSMTQKRMGSRSPVKAGLIENLQWYAERVNRYSSYADFVDDQKILLSAPAVRKALIEKIGYRGYEALVDQRLKSTATGRAYDMPAKGTTDEWLLTQSGKVANSVLPFNVVSMLKQATSSATALLELGPGALPQLIQAHLDFAKSGGVGMIRKVNSLSALMEQRFSGKQIDSVFTDLISSNTPKTAADVLIKKYSDAGWSLMEISDAISSYAQWTAGYELAKTGAIKAGKSQAEAHKIGIMYGDIVVKRSNNWTLPQDRPAYAHTAMGQLFYTFQSQPVAVFNTIVKQMKLAQGGRQTRGAAALNLLVGLGITGTIQGIVGTGKLPKDAMEVVKNMALNGAGGMQFGSALGSIYGISMAALNPTEAMLKAVGQFGTPTKALGSAATGYLAMQGVPIIPIKRTLSGIYDLAVGQSDSLLELIYGPAYRKK
jgi:hypothetical protein